MFSVTNYAGFSAAGQKAVTPPNTPGLNAWWDFADASKITTSGTALTTAIDKSTNTFTATGTYTNNGGLGTATNLPKYAASIQNGNGAAQFTAVYSVTTATNNLLKMAGTADAGSILVVANFNEGVTSGASYLYANSTNQDPHISRNGTGVDYLWASTGGTPPNIANGTTTSWHLHALTGTAGTQTARLDGGQSTATGTNTDTKFQFRNGAIGGALLGSGENYSFYIGEIRSFSTQLSLSDLQKEEGYLAWKWGLQGNLPANHPYKNSPP